MKGIQLGRDGDIRIVPHTLKDGKMTGILIADALMQDVAIVLDLKQGEVKADPLLGPNLLRFIRSRASRATIEKLVRVHLERIGTDYAEVSGLLSIYLKTL